MVRKGLGRTVIYARQSRDHTGQAAAVARQIELCTAKIHTSGGGDLLDTIVDNDVSASSGKPRAGYGRLLDLIRAGRVDTVVAYHIDRLLRSLLEMEHLIPLAEEHGVMIVTVAGDVDLSTDAGRLVGRILASVAKGEVERKGKRQKDAAVQAAQMGKAPSRGAFGHARWHRDKDGERWQPSPEQIAREAAAVAACYEGLLTGKTINSLTRQLNDAGFVTVRGNRWSRELVRAMLLNPRNAGLRYLHGERIGRGNWPEIVSEETWLAAKGILEDPHRRTNPGPARKWLGGGLFLCGQCDDSDMRTSYRDHGVRGYICRRHGHNNRSAAAIDDFVLAAVAQRLGRDDAVAALVGDRVEIDAPKLKADARGIRARIEQLGADYAEDLLTAGQVRAATQKFEARLAAIDEQLADAGRGDQLAEIIAAADPAAAFLDAGLDVQRAAIARLCTVTLLQNLRGRWVSIPETVIVDFRPETVGR